MHMMFVDESGDPGYPPGGKWAGWGGSTHFARVGVIIHGWKWRAWNDRLRSFKSNRGLTWDAEIKASDIRYGGGAFVGWDKPRREFFLRNLMELVGGNPDITLLGVVIDKRRVDTTKGDRMVKPEVRSLELLLERYNLFLDNHLASVSCFAGVRLCRHTRSAPRFRSASPTARRAISLTRRPVDRAVSTTIHPSGPVTRPAFRSTIALASVTVRSLRTSSAPMYFVRSTGAIMSVLLYSRGYRTDSPYYTRQQPDKGPLFTRKWVFPAESSFGRTAI